ncbi:MAG TPA: immune inhibitor A domain-containing protein, partial [Nocardioidaceae bacterium]|nr:immune inhibitor A domain-containing protein [Nocardioidaceae bacterium]
MNRRRYGVIGGTATITLLAAAALQGPAAAAPPAQPDDSRNGSTAHKADDRPDKLETKRRALKKTAAEMVLNGDRKVQNRGGSNAVRVAPGQWVEYGQEGQGEILSFLVEFGDKIDPRTGTDVDPDEEDVDIFPASEAGPMHNQIDEPGADDNTTYWKKDFDRQHYLDMFFNGMPEQNNESFKGVYEEMSSGRYTVNGDVSDWVQVPWNEASYGYTESNEDMTRFIDDSAEAWLESYTAQGKDPAAYLAKFDVWDRYDHDGDGDFDEPDGYIDHFQAIHAGEGEEAGAPATAIWSHRWAANQGGVDEDGPSDAKFGGIEIGNTGYWIRDYTTEPENGGLGVFAHEFGHDLGLPDFYDTQGGENSTAFWTLMSSGSWLNHGGDAIGTTPNHMGPWEKFQLGWLDYDVARAGTTSTHKLGPSYHATKKSQAVITVLPKKQVIENIGTAPEGTDFFYSGAGDARTATLTSPSLTVPADGSLAAKVNYSIEKDWDYAYAEISVGGGEFTPLVTNLSTETNENDANDGHGITGSSRNKWVDLTADLTQYAGQEAQIRFRMVNDAAVHGKGLLVDQITVGDALAEGAENGAEGWTMDKFVIAENGETNNEYDNYYIAENRQYLGYDTTLAEGPYNFGFAKTAPDKVERFPYQNGLLVWYWNTQYTDNNTSQHPGGGEVLPIDARANALTWSDGTVARNRIQAFDATFGLERTDPISLHREIDADNAAGYETTTLDVPSQKAMPVFDDSDPLAYYDAD